MTVVDCPRDEPVDRIAMIARWKPVHLGHAPVLRALCGYARHAMIGVGSANRYDVRNPFTVSETEQMIRLVLAGCDSFEVLEVPDLDDGPRWRAMVVGMLGRLDVFFTDNPYVASLLAKDYEVVRPLHLVADEDRVPVDGTMVRRKMAQGDGWQELVPPEVAAYIIENGLDRRFRRDFGLETLAAAAGVGD